MKKVRSLIALLLLLTLLSSTIACSSTTSNSATEKPTEPAQSSKEEVAKEAEADGDDPLEVSIFFPGTSFIDRSSSPVLDVIEDKTNSKIETVEATGEEWKQKLSVLISSGTEPDLMMFQSNEMYLLNKYAADGFMVGWNDPDNNLFEQHMPTASSRINDETVKKLSDSNDVLYGLPLLRDIGYGAYFVRTDWLEALNIEKPTTLEGYFEMLRAFTEDDPDGNGENDTYGIITDKSGNFELFAGPFGLPINDWFEENGQLVYGSTHPRMKEALEFAVSVYDAGYIHPESATMDATNSSNLISSGSIGMWHAVSSTNANLIRALKEVAPEGNSEVMAVPTAEGIETGISSIARIAENIDNKPKSIAHVLGMSAQVPEEKRARIAKFIDWHYSDEGNEAITYGVEGDSYTKNDDGTYTISDGYDLDKLRQLGAWDVYMYAGYIAQRGNWHQLWDEQTVENMTNTAWSAWPKQVYFVTPTGEQVEFEIEAKRQEVFQQVVSGTMSVEEGWEKWLSEFDRLGGTTWTEEMQTEYQARK